MSAAADDDLTAHATIIAAANASAPVIAGRFNMCFSVNDDRSGHVAVFAGTDACAVSITNLCRVVIRGHGRVSCDVDRAGHIFVFVAADFGIVVITILDIILNPGLQRAVAVDGHVAAGDVQGGFGFGEELVFALQRDVRAGAADVDGVAAAADVHILNGHICRCAASGLDFDRFVGCRFAVFLLDDRCIVCLCVVITLLYGLTVLCGTDGDVSVIDVPVPGQGRDRQGDCQQQGEGEREESSFHAVSSCVCIPYPAGRRTGIAPGGDLPVQWGTPLQISLHANCLALVPSISDIRPNSKPFLKNRGIIFSRRPAAKLPQNFLPSRACAGGEDGV